MDANRRQFLKGSLLGAGAAVAGGLGVKMLAAAVPTTPPPAGATMAVLTINGQLVHVPQDPNAKPPSAKEVRQGIPGRKWVMVIDLAGCDGCRTCTKACNKMHFVPPDREWIRVFQMQDAPETTPYFFPRPCLHCDNPPCTRVCPVDATFKRQDGTVLIDNERCIGCRFCMAACPYSVRVFNWARPQDPPEATTRPYSPERGFPRRIGTVEKCDFCPDMAALGQLPGCAAACPMNVIYFGDQNEDAVTNSKGDTLQLSKLLSERAGYRYMEELGTEPRVYYLPPKNRKFAPPGLPGAAGGHDLMQHQGNASK